MAMVGKKIRGSGFGAPILGQSIKAARLRNGKSLAQTHPSNWTQRMPWAEDALVEAAVKWDEKPVKLFDGHGLPPHKQEGLEIEALELKLGIAEFEGRLPQDSRSSASQKNKK